MDVVHYYETNRDLESFSCSPNGGKQKSRNNLIDDLAVDVTKKKIDLWELWTKKSLDVTVLLRQWY